MGYIIVFVCLLINCLVLEDCLFLLFLFAFICLFVCLFELYIKWFCERQFITNHPFGTYMFVLFMLLRKPPLPSSHPPIILFEYLFIICLFVIILPSFLCINLFST